MITYLRNIVIISPFLNSVITATIIHVPQDQPTIQAGIDAAADGDTVLVDTGTYVENINFNGKNLVLGSLFLTTGDTSYISQTVIDGDSSGSVVTFENGEDSTAVLSGFTITNGFAPQGGGIYCAESNPTLVNLIIIGNEVPPGSFANGGGIFCFASNLSLESVTIRDNTAASEGGGISCGGLSNPKLTNVTVTGNLAAYGGGIACESSSPTLENVVISENTSGYSGGGIYCQNSYLVLIHSTISVNAAYMGGGLYFYSSAPTISNCTITGNTAMADVTGFGGGIYSENSSMTISYSVVSNNVTFKGGGIHCNNSDAVFVNNTISGNTAYTGGGGIYCDDNSSARLVNCISWNEGFDEIFIASGSATAFYSDIQGGWIGQGNIGADPLFVDSTDFQLQEGSPCIDAGTAFFIWEGDTLINLPDTSYEGNAPDMGAFEFGVVSISQIEYLVPERFALHQNYPNPFNPVTTLRYDLPERSDVVVMVYDILGRGVRTLVRGVEEPGFRSVTWDGTNDLGEQVSAGVYLYRLQVVDFIQSRKMILLR